MKTIVGIVLAVLGVLFCMSLMGGFLVSLEPPFLVGSHLGYNAQSLLGAPGRLVPALPASVLLLLSILLVAVALRWAFGTHRDAPRSSTEPVDNDAARLEAMARDLDRVARRLEERVEALETILLDRDRSHHGRYTER